MIVVLPYCDKDQSRAEKLLTWTVGLCPELRRHTLVLLASTSITDDQRRTMEQIGQKIFGYVANVRQRTADDRPWPTAANSMFRVGCKFVAQTYAKPFLWLEPDCVPLKATWLDDLEREYEARGKKFMGAVWDRPKPHMNGNGIYPAKFLYEGPDKEPFDVSLGQRPASLHQTHNTPLIQHEWGDVPTNRPWTFPDRQSLTRIRAAAVMFHRCKDGTLIDRLNEMRTIHPAPPPNGVLANIKRAVRGALRIGSTYYHSGNLGDIIYGLYAIKLDGGGDLLIGPEQRKTSPCALPVSQDQFNLLKPFLALQPYLKKIEYSPKYPERETVDLNIFRNNWNDWSLRQHTKADTLCKMHCYTLGVLKFFREEEAWLEPPSPIYLDRIVVHRSIRYQSPEFPWKRLVSQYGGNMIFVGLEQEHTKFCQAFGVVSYWKPKDFTELAALIAGSKVFAGNQSFPLSLALGMGVKTICEYWDPSPDCRFERPTYLDQRNQEAFDNWLC